MTPITGQQIDPKPDYASRTRRREVTHAKILQEAANTFYRRGITSVGMEDVAEAAGVSKPTLYKHFPTKDLLIAECLSSVDEKHFTWFVDQLAKLQTNDEKPALAVFDVLTKWFNSSAFRGCTFINASVEVGHVNERAQLAVLSHKDRTRVWLQQLAEESGVPPSRSATIANHLMLLMEGAIITALVEGDMDAGRSAKDAAAILLRVALE
ncbi:TetR/AcrR family transcriptional regulator [Williamsia soli]|uniref:TetR/AcrR family transcriptional regulator n=1 Tax=Williamsia soli TaxID=364929 RepID=UPI001A9D4BA6|nr:TetR/AcrR family transcriptional regulator [Williamsia soli]